MTINQIQSTDIRKASYPESTIFYQVTDQDWATPDGHRWGPGTLCQAKTQRAETTGWIRPEDITKILMGPKKLKLIPAYKHPVMASMLFRAHINIDHPVMWESYGSVVEETIEGRVHCDSMRPHAIIRNPRISDYTRVLFALNAVYKVYKDEIFLNFIGDWIENTKDIVERCQRMISRTQQHAKKNKAGGFDEPFAAAAFAANWVAYAAHSFSASTIQDESVIINAVIEAKRAAAMMGMDLDLENILERTMSAKFN